MMLGCGPEERPVETSTYPDLWPLEISRHLCFGRAQAAAIPTLRQLEAPMVRPPWVPGAHHLVARVHQERSHCQWCTPAGC